MKETRPFASVRSRRPASLIAAPATQRGDAERTANASRVLWPARTRPGVTVTRRRGATHEVAEVTVSLLPSLKPKVAIVRQAPPAGERGGGVISARAPPPRRPRVLESSERTPRSPPGG